MTPSARRRSQCLWVRKSSNSGSWPSVRRAQLFRLPLAPIGYARRGCLAMAAEVGACKPVSTSLTSLSKAVMRSPTSRGDSDFLAARPVFHLHLRQVQVFFRFPWRPRCAQSSGLTHLGAGCRAFYITPKLEDRKEDMAVSSMPCTHKIGILVNQIEVSTWCRAPSTVDLSRIP